MIHGFYYVAGLYNRGRIVGKKKLQIIITFGIALMLLLSVFAGYLPTPKYVIEFTCISNSLIGLLFLFTGIRMIRGGTFFANWFYGTGAVTLLFIFLICMGSLSGAYQMNFKGAFFFLHVINPITVLIYYLIYADERENGKQKRLLLIPVPVLCYLLADYVIGTIARHYVYGFFEPGQLGAGRAFLIGCALYAGVFILGSVAFMGNRVMHQNKNGR